MHVLQDGGETVDEARGHGGDDARGLPAEGARVGLVEDEALGVACGGYDASAVADAHGVGVVGAVGALARLQHFVVDVVADVALGLLVFGERLHALAELGNVGYVGVVALLPVGVVVGLQVFLLAA